MPAVAADSSLRFHLSLNVRDMDRSVSFLSILLGCPPKKRHGDYAKFEPEDLPIVLSLEQRRARENSAGLGVAGGGAMNHLGFRLPDAAALVEVQRRMEAAGVKTQREEGVECCHAKQTKFWARDPDDNLWEMYVLEEDLPTSETGSGALAVVERETLDGRELQHDAADSPVSIQPVLERAVFTHLIGAEFPEELSRESLDEITLQGTFNSVGIESAAANILQKTFAALRPGGTLLIHALTADRRPEVAPTLPGPAAVVTHVPLDRELLVDVLAAGFVAAELTKFDDAPVFRFHGVEMRETRLLAHKPATCEANEGVVVYKGPFAQVTDESGAIFPRGERVKVDAATRAQLQSGPLAAHFAFLKGADAPTTLRCDC